MGLRRTDGLLQTDTKTESVRQSDTNTPEEEEQDSFVATEDRLFVPVAPQSMNATGMNFISHGVMALFEYDAN